MKKIKNSDKLYIGFRDFVDKEKLNEYDDEYFSRKKPRWHCNYNNLKKTPKG